MRDIHDVSIARHSLSNLLTLPLVVVPYHKQAWVRTHGGLIQTRQCFLQIRESSISQIWF